MSVFLNCPSQTTESCYMIVLTTVFVLIARLIWVFKEALVVLITIAYSSLSLGTLSWSCNGRQPVHISVFHMCLLPPSLLFHPIALILNPLSSQAEGRRGLPDRKRPATCCSIPRHSWHHQSSQGKEDLAGDVIKDGIKGWGLSVTWKV